METVKRVRIFLSSPSDLMEERQEIKKYIYDSIHIDGYAFDVVLWEDRFPATATKNVQGEINKELLEPSDMLIGIFKSRFGTKTKFSPSGTVEEIEEFIASTKPVMLYFLDYNIQSNKLSPNEIEELKKISEFKQHYKDSGAYIELNDLKELYQRLQSDILYNLNKIHNLAKSKSAKKEITVVGKDTFLEGTHTKSATSKSEDTNVSVDKGVSNYIQHSKWYMQSIAGSINEYLKNKGIEYNYLYNLTFHENVLLAQGNTSFLMPSSLKEVFNIARTSAFNDKYGNYDYNNDLRSKYTTWHQPIFSLIKQYFANPKRLSLLNVGGNSGREIIEIFGKRNVPSTICILDLSNIALSKTEFIFSQLPSMPDLKCIQSNMDEEYHLNEQFDVCLCLRSIQSTGVLRTDALIQMSKAIKPNGLIVITIPNGYLDENQQVIRGMFDYKTKDFNRSRPLELSSKIENNLRDYGFHDTDIKTLDTEIMIWGVKNSNTTT